LIFEVFGSFKKLIVIDMGRGQVVKAAGFDPAIAGSTPAAPAS
tara:strand:- start:143 stop:271 length:129 start_codon:yes stop_codon:yes gene_type:complete